MEVAKWIVALVAVFNFGGYVADAVIPFTAKQHINNPRWPPHAKFHNGQTMLLGIGLGLYSLFLLFGTGQLTVMHFYLAAVAASLYFVAMLLSPVFPGAGWSDPEFTKENGSVLGMHPQLFVGLLVCLILIAACGDVFLKHSA
jgi:hypothetical protein